MPFPLNQPFLFGILCIALVLTSGSVTCLGGDQSGIICIGDCSPTCSGDCVGRGYKNGGSCFLFFSSFMCCCNEN
ncbi:hypothetical protein AAZX31_08G348400 [Glycine max]|uniref:Defensin-like protein n=2 Tax=Glycine subgen. Soja TaxID=1462606 RepID=K7LAU9_SOYBN|nr:hypothetical protein JHK87_023441 [Glycine soja]KAG5017949.1 hypothetical protein JHK85_024085 [Glycine max]KAG5027641.1 hypothetical protein JHK86_023555 [Glycine max]KAG5138762.1 hypothetical protein JHK82_023493 [Glycine max]KAH1054711.1 hypothetical protein GYH30_023473 [Glycine max]